MQKYNLKELIEYDSCKVNPKILINEPGYRMVLVSLCEGQSTPEQAMLDGTVTVYALCGDITFHAGSTSCELHAGEVVSIEASAPHRVEAHKDSALLVLATGKADLPQEVSGELDLREVPRNRRHPLIFAKFDALGVGDSLQLLNDYDPVPLHREFGSHRPGQALWEYIVRGPSLFRIRIRRIAPSISADQPLGDQSSRADGAS